MTEFKPEDSEGLLPDNNINRAILAGLVIVGIIVAVLVVLL